MREYDYEEEFHDKEKKKHRKDRKLAQSTDRSKFKKTDSDREEKKEIDLSLPRGRVLAITGEGAWVEAQEKNYLCTMKGLLKKEKGLSKNLVAVGDWVRFEPLHEKEGRLICIEDRYSHLSRTDISGMKEQLIAVNIDQAIITVSVGNPRLKPPLIDRYLIAAERGGIHPIIAINKIDLLEVDTEEEKFYNDVLSTYEKLGYPILSLSVKTSVGIEALRSLLQHKTSVFAGQSGVGKSSLLNTCFDLHLKTGRLAEKTQKGSHTTTTAELFPLPGGGHCVDTPGIRSFAIWNLQKEEILSHFKDIAHFGIDCKFPDCSHGAEPGCAVKDALEKHLLSPLRYQSYQTLLSDCTGGPDQRTRNKMETL